MEVQNLVSKIDLVLNQVNQVILGKELQLKLALSCLIAKGHLLIEDLPGMGKTTLSHALANALGLSYNRVQFTSDLLPSDVLGITIFNKDQNTFEFHKGPIFSQVVLADEINRASPKTQSALLEAMEEYQVSVEGTSYALPDPFFVIATQNPMDQAGTYPLPESQLDRFLMRVTLGYPPAEAERELLKGINRRTMVKNLDSVITSDEFSQLQSLVSQVKVSEALLDYIQRLVTFSRDSSETAVGLSPRGALSLLRSSQAWALVEGRNYVIPDDVQAVLSAVVDHRVAVSSVSSQASASSLMKDQVAAI
ncbi:AAA family ATPase [Litoribrevibacter euphylliae]|uniref:AAA family ATPase n=1 Tax=Litoribrevibacter euphylliae TaxID=1834034 RepID=A0ABV7HAL2_9GAMM